LLSRGSRSTFYVSNVTGWSCGLEVSGGGRGVVSHAGLVLLRHLADRTGLAGGLSRALATPRILVHDRGRVLADLACAIADGARVISDFRVMSDQGELFGLVASVPTVWRTLKEIASGEKRAERRVTAAVSAARRFAWAQVAARHGALPGVRLADRTLEGVICIRLDATVVTASWIRNSRKGISKVTAIIRCWRCAITRAGSRWPGCCAAARRAATPPRTIPR
jgi:hypothetical protein